MIVSVVALTRTTTTGISSAGKSTIYLFIVCAKIMAINCGIVGRMPIINNDLSVVGIAVVACGRDGTDFSGLHSNCGHREECGGEESTKEIDE